MFGACYLVKPYNRLRISYPNNRVHARNPARGLEKDKPFDIKQGPAYDLGVDGDRINARSTMREVPMKGSEVMTVESEKLGGHVVVVTGAASGIGEAAARLCVSQGARVPLVDRDFERLEALGKSIGSSATTFTGDVAEPDTASRYVAAALEHFGRLDIALLNAGIAGKIGPIESVSSDDFDHIIRVNVRSVWSAMAALFPVMKNAGGGSIVVTASTGGVLGAPFVAPYIASKHAVIGLVKSAALEKLVKLGLEVSQDDVRELIGVPAPKDGAKLLVAPAPTAAPDTSANGGIPGGDGTTALNAARHAFGRDAVGHHGGCGCTACVALNAQGDTIEPPPEPADEIDAIGIEEAGDWEAQTGPMGQAILDAAAASTTFEEFRARLKGLVASLDTDPLAKRLALAAMKAAALGRTTDDV